MVVLPRLTASETMFEESSSCDRSFGLDSLLRSPRLEGFLGAKRTTIGSQKPDQRAVRWFIKRLKAQRYLGWESLAYVPLQVNMERCGVSEPDLSFRTGSHVNLQKSCELLRLPEPSVWLFSVSMESGPGWNAMRMCDRVTPSLKG